MLADADKLKKHIGKHNLIQFPFNDDCRFEYCDAKDAPEPLRSQLVGVDALLYIHYFDSARMLSSTLALAVLPITELTEF